MIEHMDMTAVIFVGLGTLLVLVGIAVAAIVLFCYAEQAYESMNDNENSP